MHKICSICARGGSKGVKNKNIRFLSGKPLIAHSIIQAKNTGLFDIIAVSSDSDEILDVANQWGADYLIKRPPEMAADHSPKVPAIQHCILEAEKLFGAKFEMIVDIDATSPLRLPEDINAAVRLLEQKNGTNVITAMPARRSPYFNLVELDDKGFARLSKQLPSLVSRRQDAPACFDMNASIYVWWRDVLLRDTVSVFHEGTLLYVMPEERSIDIDSELDFAFVEFLTERRLVGQ